jgi:PAS domain S-box-containing protein
MAETPTPPVSAEQALAELQREYRRLWDDNLAACATLASDGTIVDANAALARVLGADGERPVIGRTFGEFAPDPLAITKLIARVGAEARVDLDELQLRRDDGELISTIARLSATFDDQQRVKTVQLLLLEITDRKRLESRLLAVQRMDAIARLAGGLAHDFNNLLTVIGGHSDHLAEAVADQPGLRASVVAIQQSSRRAAALTRQLLAFGQRQVFNLQRVDIHRLLADARSVVANVMGERIHLHATAEPNTPIVDGDPTQIEHALVNLALHAREMLPDGGTVRIHADRWELGERRLADRPWVRPGKYLRLTFTDTSAGIDPLIHARLFEPFFTTQQLGHGSGLGLATVYGIVKQSQGYIWVESEIGKGTVFTILLPEAAAETAPAPPPKKVAGTATETILVVDDDDRLRLLLTDTLRRRGYRVLDAEGVTRAAEIFAAYTGRVDLLVCDIFLRDGAGPDLAERLHAIDPQLQVLYMSGASASITPTIGPGIGFLEKPFSLKALADKVRAILDARQ